MRSRSTKYLEAYVNRRESSLTVSIEDFGVAQGAGRRLPDLEGSKARTWSLPAINEINEHGEEGGFFVSYEGMREGKAFTKISSR